MNLTGMEQEPGLVNKADLEEEVGTKNLTGLELELSSATHTHMKWVQSFWMLLRMKQSMRPSMPGKKSPGP